MGERELELMLSAAAIMRRPDQGHRDGWFKPMHVGGTDGSYHSNLLRSLVKRGLMEKQLWGRAYAYRITPAGLARLPALSAKP